MVHWAVSWGNNMTLFSQLLAQCNPLDPVGCITPPPFITPAIGPGGKLTGVISFMNSALKLVFIIAGIWALFNVILAGIGFMSAGGDPKKFTQAWDRIWQTLLGLFIIVASFLIAAVVGILLFNDTTAILQPTL